MEKDINIEPANPEFSVSLLAKMFFKSWLMPKDQLISGKIVNPTFRIVALVKIEASMDVEIVELLQINYVEFD